MPCKRALIALLCCLLASCSSTLYSWKDVPPEPTALSPAERAAVLEHYAIRAVDGSGFLNFENTPRFTTIADATREYDLYTYAPVILKLAPETEALFGEARQFARLQLAVDGALVLGVLAPLSVTTLADQSISPETGAWIYGGMVVGLLGLGLLEFWLEQQEYARYEQIRQRFNAGLAAAYEQTP